MRWSRIESMGRAVEIDDGVEARLADPLWMLGRQWQLGELTGDDAAQPAAVRLQLRQAPLTTYRPEGEPTDSTTYPTQDLAADMPLERLVEAAPPPTLGHAGLNRSVREGRRLSRLLVDAGLGIAVRGLRAEFAFGPLDDGLPRLSDNGAAAVAMLQRRGLDGLAVAAAASDGEGAGGQRLRTALVAMSDADRARAVTMTERWASRVLAPPTDSWLSNRFEHRFSVAADDFGNDVVLLADEHQGGRVDWHSFDIVAGNHLGGTSHRQPARSHVTTIATPVRFAGMPASRWWEFEDGDVNFGDLDTGPGDLARLAVAEFAAVYNDDWFVVPVRVTRSTLARVERMQVIDTFGITHDIAPASVIDHGITAPSSGGGGNAADRRVWRFFELSGDPHVEEGRAPWLLIPPSLASTLHGPAIERVVFARDEDANLAWAIERLIEGPLGRALDRASTWSGWSEPSVAAGGAPREPRRYGDEHWRWKLEMSPPPWWVPLVPDRQNAQSEQVTLRRGRMATWNQHDASDVGPKGTLLEPSVPFAIFEEEVPRSGATVSRMWQWARWEDGSTHLWLQRTKQNGRGERSSGLQWDSLEDQAGPAPTRPAP